MPPVLYLIDGHALAYRTYFALTASGAGERLQTREGEPTAGIYGFASVLLRLLEQDQPEYLAVAFDTGKTFRDEIFPAYKATRAKMPDDLRPQIERIRAMVDTFHFPRLEMEGFEADDVLGSIAMYAVRQGFGVKIITGDRDLLQLVDERIIVNLAGNKLSEARDFYPADVTSYLGIPPGQVIDYKALVGDTSDNIPGVAGVGPKTAINLLQEYPTLDDIYANIEKISPKIREKLEKDRENAYMSQKLATIRIDLPITVNLEEARTDHINFAGVETLFKELEFRTLNTRLDNLRKGAAVTTVAPSGQQLSLFGAPAATRIGITGPYHLNAHTIDTLETLQDLISKLEKAPCIAFDTETTGIDPMRAELVGISVAIEPGEGYYIPVGHRTGERQLPLETVLAALRPTFTDLKKEKVGQNLKYDYLMLAKNGLEVRPMTFDTMIAEWLIDPASHNLGLKEMADVYLNIQMTHIEELIGKGKNQRSMADTPVSDVTPYASADAEVVLQLIPILQKRLEAHNASKLLHEMEMPLIPVLAQMEREGICLDTNFLHGMSTELNQRMIEIEKEIIQHVGFSFNLNSTQQLSKVLFETLKLSPPDRKKKTTSGHFSTAADVLEDMRGQHEVIDLILEFRELSKLKSTYIDALPLQINPETGRVHTSYNQTGSITGRLASSNPNLQNIPTRTEIGHRVRNGFVASSGKVLLSVDYSQIELRIVAHMSGDQAMLNAFHAGMDIHAATAAAIYGQTVNQITKEQRRHAKAINFGLIYGMSSFGLSRTTDLTLAEAENFVKAYFNQFPGVKKYLDNVRLQAAQQGFVETLLGRRRYFPNLQNQSNANIRNREEREAINAPVQGTAADILKLAMIHIQPALDKAGLKAHMLLQVHDELVLECPQEEIKATAKVVQSVMENAYPISIPLLTEARWGIKWGDLNPLTESRQA
jgi:DNA polymerase I